MTLDDFHPGMRVRTKEPHRGPSWVKGRPGWLSEPLPVTWTGTVDRIGRMAGVVWVIWDEQFGGTRRPQHPASLMREEARAVVLA